MLPEIYTFFISALAIIAIVLGIFILTRFNTLHSSVLKTDKIPRWSVVGMSFAALILVFSFFAPLIFSGNLYIGNFDKQDADNASTFNGFVAPFVAVSAVITTGLAFFMQYQANRQIQDQFKIQQFESQFYKMLDIHRSNVSEMSIIKEDFYTGEKTTVKSKEVFTLLLDKLHFMLKVFNTRQKVTSEYEESKFLNTCKLKLTSESFYVVYSLFFNGVEDKMDYGRPFSNWELFLDSLDQFNSQRGSIIDLELDLDDEKRKIYNETGVKIITGHANILSHYYRHLFMMVKYVVDFHIQLYID